VRRSFSGQTNVCENEAKTSDFSFCIDNKAKRSLGLGSASETKQKIVLLFSLENKAKQFPFRFEAKKNYAKPSHPM
jgi:hypothetical protein